MDCVIPYKRKTVCADFKPEETKFSYEQEVESTKETTHTDEAGKETKTKETITELKVKKVTLKTYGQSDKEDCEHFFEALEKLKRELKKVWEETSKAKDRDAEILFDAFDQMLVGTASSEWHDVLATETKRDWEAFKGLVAKYITTKILPEDAYNRQVTYMQERRKPYDLSVKDWWLRMQTIDRYLPYFMPSKEALQLWVPSADFKDWWNKGSLADQEKKRIVMTKVPPTWQEELRRVDVAHSIRNTKSTEELVDYFTTLEGLERNRRQPARRTSAGRMSNRGRVSPQRYGLVSPGSMNPYQAGRVRPSLQGRVWPSRPVQAPVQQQYGSYQHANVYQGSGSYQQGGRSGRSTSEWYGGRFGGQRNARGQARGSYGQQPGTRFQQQPRQSEAYYQEQSEVQASQQQREEEVKVETVPEEEAQEDEQYQMTEEELIDTWNESLFMDAPPDVDEEGYVYEYDLPENPFFYGDDEYG